ncbi:hypothetical protein B0H14DRAFT_3503908 [Mycena olivaceomarginata]|nr:hypothetical protein B0H14DRAFT_3503908 [Mycena olivaceomarginata]
MAGSKKGRIWDHFHEVSLRRPLSRRAQEEEIYMQVMVELDAEDDTPDNGAIEIDDDEVWGP